MIRSVAAPSAPACRPPMARRRLMLWALTLAVGLVSLLPAVRTEARPGQPSDRDRRIALLVSTLMDRRHLSGDSR